MKKYLLLALLPLLFASCEKKEQNPIYQRAEVKIINSSSYMAAVYSDKTIWMYLEKDEIGKGSVSYPNLSKFIYLEAKLYDNKNVLKKTYTIDDAIFHADRSYRIIITDTQMKMETY